MITYEELHRQLMYNPWTGLFYWKVSNSNRVKIGSIAGSLNVGDGYIEIRIDTKAYKAHILAWFYVHGYLSENELDHKDRIRTHNWINNLREASHQCNARNTGLRTDNTSGVKGVSKCNQTGMWAVKIMVNQKDKWLGRHKDFTEAVCARLAGEQCIGWEGCDSRSPAYLWVKKNVQLKEA